MREGERAIQPEHISADVVLRVGGGKAIQPKHINADVVLRAGGADDQPKKN